MYDTIQIVDVYRHFYKDHKLIMRIDPDGEAQSLSMLIRPLGRNVRKIAIVATEDYKRLIAYQQAGYEIHPMNGDRPMELRRFIRRMVAEIKQSPPKHMVVVSDDPEFVHLCDEAVELTDLSVWASEATVPRELNHQSYGYQPLEEILPSLKIARIDVRIDLENVVADLVDRGWQPNLRELIEAIHLATDDLGVIINVTGYADWPELNKYYGSAHVNYQRELTLAGGESRYVVNQHGKNTIDMKIADDIRTLVEYNPSAGGMVDIICLVTMDDGFQHVVATAQARGKKVILLGLKEHMSSELKRVANDVRYLNDFLKLDQPNKSEAGNGPSWQRKDTTSTPPTVDHNSSAHIFSRPLHVFLCHSSNDKSTVRELYQRLYKDGFDPWLDEEELLPGQDWDREIRGAVRASDAVIVCLSRGSTTKSGYVQKEMRFALDIADEKPEGEIYIIPVKLEDCEVPERLGRLHWIKLFEGSGYERLTRALTRRANNLGIIKGS